MKKALGSRGLQGGMLKRIAMMSSSCPGVRDGKPETITERRRAALRRALLIGDETAAEHDLALTVRGCDQRRDRKLDHTCISCQPMALGNVVRLAPVRPCICPERQRSDPAGGEVRVRAGGIAQVLFWGRGGMFVLGCHVRSAQQGGHASGYPQPGWGNDVRSSQRRPVPTLSHA